MNRPLEGEEELQLKLNEAHKMYLRHELRRVQCELGGLRSDHEREEAARWKSTYESLRFEWCGGPENAGMPELSRSD